MKSRMMTQESPVPQASSHQYEIDLFNSGSEKPKERLRLSERKLFLDSCAAYHSVFVEWCLKNVHEVERYLKGHCNAGVTICREQGYYGAFKMWLNRKYCKFAVHPTAIKRRLYR